MKRFALAVALSALSAVAVADIVGTYAGGSAAQGQALTISYKDDSHIRMDVGQGSYMLVSGSKAYLVTGAADGGMVIDLDTLPKFAMPGGKAPKATDPKVTVTRTGRSETVAGLKGDVFEIVADGQKHEVVLSSDRKALGLNKAFMALGKRMAQSLGPDLSRQLEMASREAQKQGYGGLLRSDRDFVLQAVKETALPASHYALPKGAAPMAVPAMPQMDPAMMQQMQEMMRQQQGR